MNEPQPTVRTLERAIFVETYEEGWDPRTIVRHLVWHGDDVHEEVSVFPSLREALDYARQAFGSHDGPVPATR